MPIVFGGGAPKIGKSAAADKEFTFQVADSVVSSRPEAPSFGEHKPRQSKYRFTFNAPNATPNSNIGMAWSSPAGSSPASGVVWTAPATSLTTLTPGVLQQAVAQKLALEQMKEQAQGQERTKKQVQTDTPAGKPRRRFHHTCTHPNMVRVYSLTLRCDICHSHGPFGWLYRCTSDREELIRHAILTGSGQGLHFDALGESLSTLVGPRPRGPESRADSFSFFAEIDAEQMQTYSPEQIATILRQRENVRKVCREDMAKRRDEASGLERLNPAWQELERTRPWIIRSSDECAYKVCPHCRPGSVDRVYVSLDGVAKGDVPATAATGFGFHIFGQRPVCDVSVVTNAGLRKAPESSTTSSSSGTDASTAHQKRPHRAYRTFFKGKLGFPLYTLDTCADPPAGNKGHLTRSHASPDLPNLASVKPATKIQLPADVLAELAPLVDRKPEEAAAAQHTTKMERREMMQGQFEAGSLEVEHGIAVLEESVELHVPDVISQT